MEILIKKPLWNLLSKGPILSLVKASFDPHLQLSGEILFPGFHGIETIKPLRYRLARPAGQPSSFSLGALPGFEHGQ